MLKELAFLQCLFVSVATQRLALSIQTFSGNHHMVTAGRNSWHRGVSTVVITNGTQEKRIESPNPETEVWWTAPDLPLIGWNNVRSPRVTA